MDYGGIARRIRGGDTSAFDELVRSTSTQLYRLAARMTGSTAEADDILQDSYLQAYDALTEGKFDGRSSLLTWLYRIVTFRSLDSLRARKRRRVAPLDDVGELLSGQGEGALAFHMALRELDDWLKELPDEQRVALVLKELEGLSSAEVADVMRTTEGAVEQKLVRARVTLRKRSEDG